MTVIALNARPGQTALTAQVAAYLDAMPATAPIVILLHGYRYDPGQPRSDPHQFIFSPHRRSRARREPSWPRHLGFARPLPAPGLCLPFGWDAVGTLRRAQTNAGDAARSLTDLIRALRKAHPAPISLLAHSLGAQIALGALSQLDAGDVGRIALLFGAAERDQALSALRSPAGRAAEVMNVTSRENALFDTLFEWTSRAASPAIGRGLSAPNLVTLRIDDPAHRKGLARLGHRIGPHSAYFCHWSAYLRPGLFPLYRRFLLEPQGLPLAALRYQLAPVSPERCATPPSPLWQREYLV